MKGFSLLEVLIALSLGSTIILSADYAMTNTASLNAKVTQNYHTLFAHKAG